MTDTRAVPVGRRADRAAVVSSLAVIATIGWIVTVRLANGMPMGASSMDMAPAMPPGGSQLVLVTAMWAAMMVGMMVPSATPMVAAYAGWTRLGSTRGSRSVAIASFLSGYVLVWTGFSVLAAVLQAALERVGLLTATGALSHPALSGTVLVLAGAFQVTPWKESCLRRCRTPAGFLIAEWRDGAKGAVVMGTRHGVFCLGCCWLLMAVLFVVGTMHVTWMAAIAGLVLAEKVAPRSLRVSYGAAVALVSSGAWILLNAAT